MREKIVIKQYKAHPNIEGINVLDKENRLTRPDAIERMAKALAFVQAKTFVDKNQWEIVMRGCRYEAEAALDALLGAENGE